jgi:NAD(P)-dependent dehydrogenase (short-subunit alcohol dehydrogenase family)
MSDQRITVVTGGASGIGRGAVMRQARGGDLVVIADINQADAENTLADIAADGGQAIFRPCDVADDAQVSDLFEAIEQDHGPIDVLINSAGLLQKPMPIEETTMDDYDRVHAVNVRGLYVCCREITPRMRERRRGVILNIASNTSLRAFPLPTYGPGKSAVMALTEILAAELGPYYVRVNAVAPTACLTPPLQARIDAGERDYDMIVANNAIPRMLLPEDVAEGIFFLCSDRAKAITGATLPVDYGWQVWLSYRAYPS